MRGSRGSCGRQQPHCAAEAAREKGEVTPPTIKETGIARARNEWRRRVRQREENNGQRWISERERKRERSNSVSKKSYSTH